MGEPRKILVATDLSTPADEAIREGHERAAGARAELGVCLVVPNELRSNPLFPQLHQLQEMRVPFDRERLLEALAERTRTLTSRSSDSVRFFLEEGIPHAAIVGIAESWRADLVVVGSSGATGLARIPIGSVAQRVVRHAHCPVLVARRHEETASIVVGTDFSDPALPAVSAAADESRRTGARLTIVHSIEPELFLSGPIEAAFAPPPLSGQLLSDLKEAADARLAAALEQCGVQGERRVRYGPAAVSLVQIAEELRAELVVVGTAGRTGLRRVLLGSVAEGVIGAAPCSVLVVRLHQE